MNQQQWNGRRKRKGPAGLNRRMILLLGVCGALVVFGIVGLVSNALQRRASEKTDEDMRAIYHAEGPVGTEEGPAGASADPEAFGTAASGQEETMPAEAEESAVTPGPRLVEEAPAVTQTSRLAEMAYPGNPGLKISSRFQALRQENRDIVGWLTIGSMTDEAVVQRDNEYYMDHNAKKEEDISGAIFMDAIVSLKTRPYGIILYGHNMRTGARFGCLRNYEKLSFYRNYPFLSFDTLYEDGRYVIFSVGTVSTVESEPTYLDFFALTSLRTDERQQAIARLEAVSMYSCAVDVQPEDQLLVMTTCVEKESDRRIVAARRIRDGESEQELRETIAGMTTQR